MKALIGISVSREWSETEFLQQLGTWKIPRSWQIKYGWLRQFTAAERHNATFNNRYEYDRILFMDTDQIYPYEYLEMMLSHEEPIVSALTVARYYPFDFCVYKYDGEEHNDGVVYPRILAVQPPAEEKIFECDITGTGALMIDTKIIDKLTIPYFRDIYDKDGMRLVPDDFYFGWQLYKAGLKILVDQNIIVNHIAKIVASPYNVRDLRRAWLAVNSGHGYWKDGKP